MYIIQNILLWLSILHSEIGIFEVCAYLFKIKAGEKNNHRHIFDIPRIIFFA